MPRETYSTTTRSIAMDDLAQARAIAAVADVQASYSAFELKVYGSNNPPDIDADYVRTHAITIGLNRWGRSSTGPHAPTAETFTLQEGTGVSAVAVDVTDDDLARAQNWADALRVSVEAVLSAALCTGIAALVGDRAAAAPGPQPALGPFAARPS